MGWFARTRDRAPTDGPSLERGVDSVELRLPLGIREGELACWLSLRYRESDPLVIGLELCAPSGGLAVERSMLRSDFRRAARLGLDLAGVVIGPEEGGYVPLLIREGAATIAAVIPATVLDEFLQATNDLVPPGWDAETAAVNRALVAMLEGR